jgi:CRP-like cAMP-binding protein
MEEFATIFSVNNIPGHISYVLIAISYWLTDIYWLRVVAILGLAMEILYFTFSGGDLRAGIGWDLVFIAINAYQLYRLIQERRSLRLPEAERDLLRSVFTGLEDAQIARLLLAGEFSDLQPGAVLTTENKALEKIFFICTGSASVTIGGREISSLGKGNFVGEVAFLTGQPATATVVAQSDVRALVFEKGRLNLFFNNETEVAGLIYQLLGRELAHKMKVSNSLLSAGSATA